MKTKKWCEADTVRRVELIMKDINGKISDGERVELETLTTRLRMESERFLLAGRDRVVSRLRQS